MTETLTSITKLYIERHISAASRLNVAEIDKGVELISDALENNKQIFTMGNGGSAATASHYIADWNKGISYQKEKRLRCICLNDNIPTMMAYSNDVSYESVFVEQLKNFMQEGDLVIGISGSGNSMNVINAIEYANENKGVTLGICGYSGGKLKQIAKHSIWVNINDMQIVEDLHLTFGHIVMQSLCGGCK